MYNIEIKKINSNILKFLNDNHVVLRYLLLLVFYSVQFEVDINKILIEYDVLLQKTHTHVIVSNKQEQENQEEESNIELINIYKQNKKNIHDCIVYILDNFDVYKKIINDKLIRISFNSITKMLQCVLILICFEIIAIKSQKQLIIANYLTIMNIFGFTKKEIGFMNRIVDTF